MAKWRATKAAVLAQFRYNWNIAVAQNPSLKGDIVRREKTGIILLIC